MSMKLLEINKEDGMKLQIKEGKSDCMGNRYWTVVPEGKLCAVDGKVHSSYEAAEKALNILTAYSILPKMDKPVSLGKYSQ